jgi:hypothetical protein
MTILRSKFFKWCSSSLQGHLVLVQLMSATPLSAMFILIMYSEGTLTLGWGVFITALCSVLFGIGAALFWYIFSKPLVKRRGIL